MSVAKYKPETTIDLVTADKENLPHFQMRLNVFRGLMESIC